MPSVLTMQMQTTSVCYLSHEGSMLLATDQTPLTLSSICYRHQNLLCIFGPKGAIQIRYYYYYYYLPYDSMRQVYSLRQKCNVTVMFYNVKQVNQSNVIVLDLTGVADRYMFFVICWISTNDSTQEIQESLTNCTAARAFYGIRYVLHMWKVYYVLKSGFILGLWKKVCYPLPL